MGVEIDLVAAAAAAVIGVFIGATGLGGVALAPALNSFQDVPLHLAVSNAMGCFVVAGIIAAIGNAALSGLSASQLVLLMISAGVAAFAGSLTIEWVRPETLRIVLAALMIASGAFQLGKTFLSSTLRPAKAIPSSGPLCIIATMTGFGSALTGTGGPLIMLPILLAAAVPIQAAVITAQLSQIPIGISALAGHALNANLDPTATAIFAVLVGIGVVLGMRVARFVSQQMLANGVACLLIGCGVLFLVAP